MNLHPIHQARPASKGRDGRSSYNWLVTCESGMYVNMHCFIVYICVHLLQNLTFLCMETFRIYLVGKMIGSMERVQSFQTIVAVFEPASCFL